MQPPVHENGLTGSHITRIARRNASPGDPPRRCPGNFRSSFDHSAVPSLHRGRQFLNSSASNTKAPAEVADVLVVDGQTL